MNLCNRRVGDIIKRRYISSWTDVYQAPSSQQQLLASDKLTASTFGRAVGFCSCPDARVNLWLDKIGAIEPFAGGVETWWNNIKPKEPFENYKFVYRSFNPTHPPNILPRDDNHFLAASPDDSFVYDGLPYGGILEIKCPYFDGGDKTVSYPWEHIPEILIPQAQGLMEILDQHWMHVYCWTINGSSVFWMKRDKVYWDFLKEALCDFWREHVQPAKEIMCYRSVIKNPVGELISLMPAPKHHLYREIVNQSKLVADDSLLLLTEIQGQQSC